MSKVNLINNGPKQRHYSEVFKRKVVQEYENGQLNKEQLRNKYQLKGKSQVLKWCRKFGKFDYTTHHTLGRLMKDPQKQRIRELEKKLRAAELKLKVYDKLIEVTNRELDADIVKKIEARLSESWQQKNK